MNSEYYVNQCQCQCVYRGTVNGWPGGHFLRLAVGRCLHSVALTMSLKYSLTALYKLKRGCGYPDSAVIVKLKELNIFHARSRRKKRTPKPIPTIITENRKPKEPSQPPAQNQCTEVPRLWFSLPTLLLSNVTSLPNKLEELSVATRTVNAGVIAITECWQITPETNTISDYFLFHRLRTNKRGGGVALYCHKDLNPHQLDVQTPEGIETVWVRIQPARHPRQVASIIYCVVYHPPRSNNKDLLIQHLIDTADFMRTKFPRAKLVLCGDFNEINCCDIQDPLQLTQVVNFPTHGNNTLDKIFTDVADQYLTPRPLPPFGRSTHLSVLWSPSPTYSHPRGATCKTYRPLTDSAIRHFGQWITQHPWTEVTSCEDVETKWNQYHATITQAYHHFFPEKTVSLHPADAPWITHRIKRLIQERDRAFHHHQTDLYKGLRNKVIREIRYAKKAHYPSKLQHLKHRNIGQWYDGIKNLIGCDRNKPSSLPFISHLSSQEAAQQINSHFADICQQLPPLDRSSLPAFLPARSPPPHIEEFQVAKRLQSLKSRRSITPIDLPIRLYKEFAPELATPLTSIFNASIKQSKSPTPWKTAYVTPLPKVTNPQAFTNLRPVAITPIPSLICEGFVFDWAYADIAHSVDTQQFGNMKSSSTTHCLISLLDFVYRNLEKRKTSVALTFVDFTKAFDLVNHNIILRKALDLGLRGCLISWLADFLTSRQQAVRYRGATSAALPLSCGVPQGTKMGPLCFLILINDALRDTDHRWKYVDDSTFGTPIDNDEPDFSALQTIMDNLQQWTAANDVTINSTKTVVMHINLGANDTHPPAITLGRDVLQVVGAYKLLGITIDNELNWKTHVSTIIQSSSYRLYLLRRLKSLGVPPAELKEVYTTFILPKLTYASPAWASSLTYTQSTLLEKVQKRACRIIMGPQYSTYQEALTTLKLTTLAEHHKQAAQKFGHKLLNHPRHRDLLPPAAPPPRAATRHQNLLKPIRARTDRYKNSPIPYLVRLINA